MPASDTITVTPFSAAPNVMRVALIMVAWSPYHSPYPWESARESPMRHVAATPGWLGDFHPTLSLARSSCEHPNVERCPLSVESACSGNRTLDTGIQGPCLSNARRQIAHLIALVSRCFSHLAVQDQAVPLLALAGVDPAFSGVKTR